MPSKLLLTPNGNLLMRNRRMRMMRTMTRLIIVILMRPRTAKRLNMCVNVVPIPTRPRTPLYFCFFTSNVPPCWCLCRMSSRARRGRGIPSFSFQFQFQSELLMTELSSHPNRRRPQGVRRSRHIASSCPSLCNTTEKKQIRQFSFSHCSVNSPNAGRSQTSWNQVFVSVA